VEIAIIEEFYHEIHEKEKKSKKYHAEASNQRFGGAENAEGRIWRFYDLWDFVIIVAVVFN
jgi:hypothetical protein